MFCITIVVMLQKSKRKLLRNDKSPIKKKKNKVIKTPDEKFHTQGTGQDIFSPSKQGNTSQMLEENSPTLSDETDINLEAWNSFSLPQVLLEGLKDLNFTQPTQIQALTLPAALLGKYILLFFLKLTMIYHICRTKRYIRSC